MLRCVRMVGFGIGAWQLLTTRVYKMRWLVPLPGRADEVGILVLGPGTESVGRASDCRTLGCVVRIAVGATRFDR